MNGAVSLRTAAFVVAVIMLSGFLAGCGVESVAFIAGPESDRVEVDAEVGQIRFLHNEDDNDTDEFRGYELYYKFYADTDSDCGDTEPCGEDRAYVEEEPLQTGPSRLLGRDFSRMIYEPSPGERPNVPISQEETGSEFEIAIDLSSFGQETQRDAIVSWNESERPLKRGVTAETSQTDYKSFIERADYDDEDADVQSAIDGPTPEETVEALINNGNLYLSVYTLGYGIDPGSLQALYSEPVYLGYVRIDPRSF